MIRYSPLSSTAAAALFLALAVWTMAPALADLHSAIPGNHLGDNATGLWNVWWFSRAVEEGRFVYWTDELFAPLGTQLSLHTHATTHSALALPMRSFTSLLGAHNLALVAGLALNGICAWLLAFRLTHRLLPSMVAGVLFACSAHVQLRVLGHINLVHAWVLPLFVLALMWLEHSRRLLAAVAVGAVGALVIYTDYYYGVYAFLFSAVWAATHVLGMRAVLAPPRAPLVRRVLLALIVLDLLLIAAIVWGGGTVLEFGPIRISARGMRNPLTVLWILVIAWALLRFPVSGSVRIRERVDWQAVRLSVAAFVVLIVLVSPLLLALAGVVAAGEYTAPRVLWRSSPAGADLATLVLGHPLHFFTGNWTTAAYTALGIDVMEQSLWLGLAPLALIVATRRRWREAPGARFWIVVALFFLVLSLGPFLRVGGFDTALPLPYAVLRYLPGIGNARIPGRAVVMVHLAVAVLTAVALSSRHSRSRAASLAVVGLLVVETWPAATRVQRTPPADAVDEFLFRSSESGAVAELPTGLRDGFGEIGALDHRALVHQLWHGRSLVGGFVARLSPRVRARYEEEPILMNLLELSTHEKHEVGLMGGAADEFRKVGIAYLIVNRDTFIDSRLPEESLQSTGFRLVQRAGPRELYAVIPRGE